MLTGQIRINDIRWGFASREAPAEAWWEDEGLYRTYASGRVERVTPRWRLRGRFSFSSLSGPDLAQLKGATDEPFTLTLRSRADGDPADWPELEVLVRRTSAIEETGPLYRRMHKHGRQQTVYRAVVEFEAVSVVSEVPGALEGGFEYLGSGTFGDPPHGPWETHDIEPWGDATLTLEEVTLDVDGVPMTLSFYVPGPSMLAGLVFHPDPSDPLLVELDATGTYRVGPPEWVSQRIALAD